MHKKSVVFIIGCITIFVFLSLTWSSIFKRSSFLSRVNHIFYDINLKFFHKKKSSDNIVIVDLDEKSLQEEGRWPWSRNKLATVVNNLKSGGAAVVVFDILFPESEPNISEILLDYAKKDPKVSSVVVNYLAKHEEAFDNDQILADSFKDLDVVLGVFFSGRIYQTIGQLGKPILAANNSANLSIMKQSKYIGNIPVLINAAKHAGFTTTLPDEDGSIRRSPLLIKYGDNIYPSLGLEVARVYFLLKGVGLDLHQLGKDEIFLGVYFGKNYIPTDLVGNILINFRGPAFSFPYISASDVLRGNFLPQFFQGKIVLIGSSAIGIGDLHSTPLQAVTFPGTEVHANIIASILDNDMISSPLWMVGVERILLAILGLILTLVAAYSSALVLILLSVLMLVLLFFFNGFLLVHWGLVLPYMVLPYFQVLFLGLVNSGFGYLFETRTRKKLHDVYGQYVSSAYIDKMLETNDVHTLAGNTKSMTVLFADIRSFTSISEKLEAKEVKKFLNTLFTPLTEIIFEFKGTIDKYVGDMVMAFWNDPIDDSEHASHCVKAALMMQKKVKELAPVFAEQNLNNVAIRVGINTGVMHVGDMGSQYRKAYTVLGDAVNLASRLEGVNKLYGTDILVSGKTKDSCKGVLFRFIDRIYVKGKKEPTDIYQPLCLISEKTSELEQELMQYQRALVLYDKRQWDEAVLEFKKLVINYPHVFLYDSYLRRVTEYQKQPPDVDWDGGQHLIVK